MKIKLSALCVLLLANPGAWAEDAPAVDAVPVAQPATLVADPAPISQPEASEKTVPVAQPAVLEADAEVELPVGFIEAQPISVPKKSFSPVDSKPPVEILPYQIEAGYGYSMLNKGYQNWSNTYVNAEMKLGERNNIYAAIRKENRYSATDSEMMGGFYQPVDERFSIVAEGSVSFTHLFLPSRSLLGQVEYLGNNGWSANAGLRHTEYDTALVNLLSMTAERSWGNYRVAYTHFQGFVSGKGSTNSNQIQAAKYYGEHSWYGVTLSDGNEAEVLPSLPIQGTPVRSLVAKGRHWLNPNIALVYMVGNHRLGQFYTRNGIQLGLRYQF
jgi:YaiO family outer membrane protein